MGLLFDMSSWDKIFTAVTDYVPWFWSLIILTFTFIIAIIVMTAQYSTKHAGMISGVVMFIFATPLWAVNLVPFELVFGLALLFVASLILSWGE